MATIYSDDFAQAVRRALGNRSYRQVAARARISASYIGDLVQGRVPKRDIVIAFAEATGADVGELLRLAGYDPLPQPTERPKDYFWRKFGELADEAAALGLPTVYEPRFAGGSDGIESIEEADTILAIIRERCIDGPLAQRAAAKGEQP